MRFVITVDLPPGIVAALRFEDTDAGISASLIDAAQDWAREHAAELLTAHPEEVADILLAISQASQQPAPEATGDEPETT